MSDLSKSKSKQPKKIEWYVILILSFLLFFSILFGWKTERQTQTETEETETEEFDYYGVNTSLFWKCCIYSEAAKQELDGFKGNINLTYILDYPCIKWFNQSWYSTKLLPKECLNFTDNIFYTAKAFRPYED